jgi:hypothetical protein
VVAAAAEGVQAVVVAVGGEHVHSHRRWRRWIVRVSLEQLLTAKWQIHASRFPS